MQKRTWIMPSQSKSRTSVFVFCILDKGGTERKIMHDDGQSAEIMLVSRFLYHHDPQTMIQVVREPVLSCQTLFSHRCSCRTCRMWYRICVVASLALKSMWQRQLQLHRSVRPLSRGLAIHIRSMVGVETVLCV
jgi:hypothetical protein